MSISPALKDLLFTIRQHRAYQELLATVEVPPPREFKPSQDAQQQWADFIFRSGRRAQHDAWQGFLTTAALDDEGTSTSQKEQS